MLICGEISGDGNGDFAGAAAAVTMHALEGIEGAVVGALGLGANAQVDAEFRLLFLCKGFGNTCLAAIVMAADVLPEFAVDAANSL
jgi:hypothetical protein